MSPRNVTNMTNAMELLKKAPKCVLMQQNSDIAISQNNSVLYNMFICQSNQNHLIIRRVGTLEFFE